MIGWECIELCFSGLGHSAWNGAEVFLNAMEHNAMAHFDDVRAGMEWRLLMMPELECACCWLLVTMGTEC